MPAAEQAPALVSLACEPSGGTGFLGADFVPARGMMMLRLRARLPTCGDVDLIVCPSLEEALQRLSDPQDGHGNAGFAFGGALLFPFANRITSPASPFGPLDLEPNWGGKAPGAARYAMHGLMLRTPFEVVEHTGSRVVARRLAEDFAGRWPGCFDITVTAELSPDRFDLSVEAVNAGGETAPVGIGWHPYFNLPSGRREQARLHVPATHRALVNNYDEVLPTGELQRVAGTAYDVSAPAGRPLDDLYLDDCFTGLPAAQGAVARLTDPAAGYQLSIHADAPPVRAVQVYAPPDQAFVVVEPQFNLADPFSPAWPPDLDTGMIGLRPGETTRYVAHLTLT